MPPHYLTGVRARLRCATYLVVLTTRRSVARWAAQPNDLGSMSLQPFVIGPERVPSLVGLDVARRAPELAVLAVLAHRRSEHVVDTAMAARSAVRDLDEERARLYDEMVMGALSEAARKFVEAQMATSGYPYPSTDYVRKHHAFAKRESLLRCLAGRQIVVDTAARARIDSCTDLASLDAWIEHAAVASNLQEVFRGAAKTPTDFAQTQQAIAKREALVSVLTERGWPVDPTTRDRIESCNDLAVLASWIRRAVTAADLDEVFRHGG